MSLKMCELEPRVKVAINALFGPLRSSDAARPPESTAFQSKPGFWIEMCAYPIVKIESEKKIRLSTESRTKTACVLLLCALTRMHTHRRGAIRFSEHRIERQKE